MGSIVLDRAKARGRLVVGVRQDQPGLGILVSGTDRYEGFDIEMARVLATRLGFDPNGIEFKAVPAPDRETAIANGEIDYYIGTYSITRQREEKVGFGGPYLVTGQGVMVRADESTITGMNASLSGHRVCSATGSSPLLKVQREFPQAAAVGLDSYARCVDALLAGQVDAVTTDQVILQGYAARDSAHLKIVGAPVTVEKYGIGVDKNDQALRGAINATLRDLAVDGTWKSLYAKSLQAPGAPTPEAPSPEGDDQSGAPYPTGPTGPPDPRTVPSRT
ncbi:glutamate ABC transporter substrate-binding protein [Streptomyces sp. SID3343]|uniref:transporter substrate-binding domain-containing protein n=1 Tax=Streptomyces sp. SID3343 TaxID=2690260 RepID=UPI001368F650|nr:transporter substrate-binding domain-containing protein [Streptomyces sp. SID3343]